MRVGVYGYIAQWLERLTADQQVPGSNPGVPSILLYGGASYRKFSNWQMQLRNRVLKEACFGDSRLHLFSVHRFPFGPCLFITLRNARVIQKQKSQFEEGLGNARRRGGIEPLHVSMPRELKSRPSTSPTHPGLRSL